MDPDKGTEPIEHVPFSRRAWRFCKQGLLNMFYFCQLNGSYIALYGLMLPSILMNILSAVFNEYRALVCFPHFQIPRWMSVSLFVGGWKGRLQSCHFHDFHRGNYCTMANFLHLLYVY